MPRYRPIDHTADMGAYFYGADAKEVFINAALVFFEFMVDRPPVSGNENRVLTVEGTDYEDLVVRWLGELLYLFQVQGRVLTGVDIETLSPTGVTANLTLTPFDFEKHGVDNDIKAVTYHQVEFRPVKKGWRAKIFFDL